jgi:2-polyprenyl-3-methyl-5-hydroxy-6-metoxy-1,4-benzoquinol methylase
VSEVVSHWDGIYSSAPSTTRSWYERDPAHSLRLVTQVVADRSAAIIDVGAGTSALVDRLLESGFDDVTALDVSSQALDEVRERLGVQANRVSFLVADVLAWRPERTYDVWHDRAVFHFLTDSSSRERYVSLAAASVRVGGALIVATFADDGPTHCSGLPVFRYSGDELADAFAAHFELVQTERELHVTPSGAVQPFTWAVLRRNPPTTG